MPVLLPLPARPVPRVVPYVRLAPVEHPRRSNSWAAIIAVFLLGATVSLLGAVVGTVFWFTYDLTGNAEPVSYSPVMARLAELPPIVQSQAQAAPPADIVLPVESPASAAQDVPAVSAPAAANTDDMQMVVHEGKSTDIDALLENARAQLEQGESGRALALYERVLVQEPGNHAALEGKAYALGRFGRADAAAAVLKNILKSNPQDAEAHANLMAMLGASASLAALTELQHMVEETPDDASVQAALAKALALRGDVTEAIPHLDHAVHLAPGDVALRFDLAVVYDHAGQAPQALSLYRQIMQIVGDGACPITA